MKDAREKRADGTIRALRETDVPGVLALFDAVAAERKWIGTEPGFDRDRYRRGWSRVLAGEWGAVFVALDGEVVIGYIGIHPHDEYGHTIGMLVDEAHRGRGIGEALLRAALDWARERRLPDVSLLVFPHNERAIKLYRKLGFEQRDYYPNDVTRQTGEVWDTILMTKTLS
jgi:ribosomal protein S18 acetylase RimI-like enzyme